MFTINTINCKFNYNCLGNLTRFNSKFEKSFVMSKNKKILSWIGIIGGMIGFFFFSQIMVDFMR